MHRRTVFLPDGNLSLSQPNEAWHVDTTVIKLTSWIPPAANKGSLGGTLSWAKEARAWWSSLWTSLLATRVDWSNPR